MMPPHSSQEGTSSRVAKHPSCVTSSTPWSRSGFFFS
jgi:hypothetical protein